jgi:hypothetical protein
LKIRATSTPLKWENSVMTTRAIIRGVRGVF